MKNRSGIIKIVAAVTGAVSLLCMAVLLVNYLCNEHFISEYKKLTICGQHSERRAWLYSATYIPL